ncbi:MAG: tetratricopeptide repeat protein [Bryobacterales bacterium]|nr:tetratricopeptide repeat protein [Bryobacterales bacterium]
MMRAAATALAAGVLLTGCAPKARVARVAPPAKAMRPVMQRQVLNAVDAGEGNPRVRALREKLAAEPQNVALRVELAAEYGKQGYTELELEHLRLAAERFPESEEAVIALSRTLVRVSRPDEAAVWLRGFLAKQAKAPANVLSWAGIAEDERGKWKDGEPYHRQAVERAPGRDALHNNLGYNLLMQGRKGDAAEEFRRALELNPASETARNNLGLALGDQPAAAITQFRQTADLAVAHNNLAAYLYEKGDLAGARKELELALEYRKDMPQILDNLRKVAAADGEPVRMPREGKSSFWKLFARGLKQTFISGEDKQASGSAEAAR